ncbi:MAG TPA: tetratricopeptide repeat protein [Solirubrobacteraceae bacterium]|jgi:putative thioredoxin|nr:tetratricopeptide repeat protein [Solirubrobacteraceae bacterium]
MAVIDVSEADFAEQVLERSRTVPVVVDFWAEWCAPCRQLGPLLEDAARAREGKVVLAKLDTDANPNVAQAFQIRGIPAVKAFKDGRVDGEFVGLQGRPEVERFFDALLPSEADELVATGDEAALRRAVELEPGRADAAVPLARMLLGRGETDQALELLEPVRGSFQADGLAARLRLERDGRLADAFAALDEGEVQRGLQELLEALSASNGDREEIRRVIVGELDALGPEDPVARETRRRLATALY